MYEEIKYLPGTDQSLYMEFGNSISPEINRRIRQTLEKIEKENLEEIIELIPTYRSILVIYDPLKTTYWDLVDKLKNLAAVFSEEETAKTRIFDIPIVYGGDYGPDIDFVCDHNGLSRDEVIQIHTSKSYLVYMLGFTPGFTYLGGMDERIETPRLEVPRTKIPAGSTGIAGSQTGIYPIESPGGWQLIGRTALKLYDPSKDEPVFLKAGDYVKFYQVREEDHLEIKSLVDKGQFEISYREEIVHD